jgi:exopolysaccharide biosynthesis polyprenyl glycosylphosphotransferase
MIVDLMIVCVGTLIGQRLFVWWHPQTSALVDYKLWLVNSAMGLSVVLAGLMFGLYEQTTLWHRGRIVARALLTITFATMATFIVVQVFMYSEMSRRTAAFAIVFYVLAATSIRMIAHRVVQHVQLGLLLIGHGATTSLLLRSVQHGRLPGYKLHGIVSDDPGRHGRPIRGIPVLGGIEELTEIIAERDIHEIVVADGARHSRDYQLAALVCLRMGCRVTNETTFYEAAFGEVPVAHVDPNWFFHADLSGQREEHATMKRVFDLCAAAIGLVITLPMLPFVALAIWVCDRGPVFYSQMRVGAGGREFKLYKLRTMRTDAEKFGTVWAADNDPRVTTIGRLLRRTRLDELPQFWNVLRGDMSMVGPRPERPDIVSELSRMIPYYQERHLIKPGISGWAQIRYRYGASIADARRKLQYDLYYIKHMSLELDLVILLRTVGTFLLGAR